MKEFKKGDRVVLMRSLCSRWNVGQTFVVDYLWPSGVWVTLEGVTQCVHVANLMNEREFVEMCINAIMDRRIEVENIRCNGQDNYKISVRNQDGTNIYYRKCLKQFLDSMYPTETPQQKQLRELEEQQRKLADQIKSLREEM